MKVYRAELKDIGDIVAIYNLAVDHMYNENNTNQWQKNNDKFVPSITKYIEENNFYVVKEHDEIIGFFVF